MRAFLNNIELWLSAAGLLVIWAVPALFSSEAVDPWKVATITATAVGVLHGGIFWVIRRRQRRIRQQAILEIREMLADVVKNQLAIIGMWLPGKDRTMYEEQIDGITESVTHISELVDTLSEEAIEDWKTTYREALESTGALEPA